MILLHGDVTRFQHSIKKPSKVEMRLFCPALIFLEIWRFLTGPTVLFSQQVPTVLRKTKEILCERVSLIPARQRES